MFKLSNIKNCCTDINCGFLPKVEANSIPFFHICFDVENVIVGNVVIMPCDGNGIRSVAEVEKYCIYLNGECKTVLQIRNTDDIIPCGVYQLQAEIIVGTRQGEVFCSDYFQVVDDVTDLLKICYRNCSFHDRVNPEGCFYLDNRYQDKPCCPKIDTNIFIDSRKTKTDLLNVNFTKTYKTVTYENIRVPNSMLCVLSELVHYEDVTFEVAGNREVVKGDFTVTPTYQNDCMSSVNLSFRSTEEVVNSKCCDKITRACSLDVDQCETTSLPLLAPIGDIGIIQFGPNAGSYIYTGVAPDQWQPLEGEFILTGCDNTYYSVDGEITKINNIIKGCGKTLPVGGGDGIFINTDEGMVYLWDGSEWLSVPAADGATFYCYETDSILVWNEDAGVWGDTVVQQSVYCFNEFPNNPVQGNLYVIDDDPNVYNSDNTINLTIPYGQGVYCENSNSNIYWCGSAWSSTQCGVDFTGYCSTPSTPVLGDLLLTPVGVDFYNGFSFIGTPVSGGDIFYCQDTNQSYQWNGTTWILL